MASCRTVPRNIDKALFANAAWAGDIFLVSLPTQPVRFTKKREKKVKPAEPWQICGFNRLLISKLH